MVLLLQPWITNHTNSWTAVNHIIPHQNFEIMYISNLAKWTDYCLYYGLFVCWSNIFSAMHRHIMNELTTGNKLSYSKMTSWSHYSTGHKPKAQSGISTFLYISSVTFIRHYESQTHLISLRCSPSNAVAAFFSITLNSISVKSGNFCFLLSGVHLSSDPSVLCFLFFDIFTILSSKPHTFVLFTNNLV